MPEETAAPAGAELLADCHRDLGAEIEPTTFGFELPMHYGSVRAEYDQLRRSCGLADRSWAGSLELHGEDRVRFLNGLVTCDVREPGVGQGVYGFFTDAKGRVISDVAVLVHEDHLLLELAPGRTDKIAEHLRKYVITDRVEIRDSAHPVALALAGPSAEGQLDELAGEPAPREDWEHRSLELCGYAVEACRHPRLGLPGFMLRVAAPHAPDLLRAQTVGQATLALVGHAAMEAIRVEAGLAVFGIDLDAATLPQETGLVAGVSYTKGCYLGQEIVARIHYRGQVNRQLRGLLFEAGEPATERSRVSFETGVVGEATSVLLSPELGRPIAMVLIHRKAAEPGTSVEVEGFGQAAVTELPFVTPGG